MTSPRQFATVPQAELDLLLHWLPIIVAAPAEQVSDWERKFCASVIAASRRPSKRGPWRPSARQVAVMRRLVARFKAETLGPEGECVE